MGVRGPVPKANRKAAHVTATTPQARTAPTPPKHLTAALTALWARLWERCQWLDPDLDREAVLRYLDGLLERALLLDAIAAEGRTSRGSMGQVVTSPLVAQIRGVNAELAQLESALGLTSAARTRQGLEIPTPQTSKLDELTARRARLVSAGPDPRDASPLESPGSPSPIRKRAK